MVISYLMMIVNELGYFLTMVYDVSFGSNV